MTSQTDFTSTPTMTGPAGPLPTMATSAESRRHSWQTARIGAYRTRSRLPVRSSINSGDSGSGCATSQPALDRTPTARAGTPRRGGFAAFRPPVPHEPTRAREQPGETRREPEQLRSCVALFGRAHCITSTMCSGDGPRLTSMTLELVASSIPPMYARSSSVSGASVNHSHGNS